MGPDVGPDVGMAKEQATTLSETAYTQPALFVMEYALTELWQTWGIKPDVVIGHSVGEMVAACVAGVFSLEDGLKLVATRGRLMSELPRNGAMVSLLFDDSTISSAEARVQQAIAPYHNQAAIAAINGPGSIVLSGKRETVLAITEQLAAEGVKTRQLTVSHAFHSPLMEPMLDEFRQVAAAITYHNPKLSVVSNLTGRLVNEKIARPDYWVRHAREAVRFADGVQTLHELGVGILVEIGPKPVLVGMAQQCLDQDIKMPGDKASPLPPTPCLFLPSLRENQSDWQQMLASLGELYVYGVNIDWRGFDKDYQQHKVALPTYPFQRKRCWVDNANPRPHAPLQPMNPPAWLAQCDLSQLSERLIARKQLTADEARLLPRVLALLAEEEQAVQASETIQEAFYAVDWQPKARSTHQAGAQVAQLGGYWIICADQSGVGEALAAEVAAAGDTPILIYQNGRGQELHAESPNRWTLDPNQPEQFVRFWQSIHALAPTRPVQAIVHLWGLGGLGGLGGLDVAAASDWSAPGLMAAQQVGCGSIAGLLRLLEALNQPATRLWLVTQGAHAVHNADSLANLAHAPLWGMGRTIALETPDYWGGLIDLPPGQGAAASAHDLFAELLDASTQAQHNAPRDEQIALRQNARYVAQLKPVKAEPVQPVTLQADATYLITGGLGGLGLAIARGLAEQGARHLVLTSRRGMTTATQQAAVTALEQMGVQLHLPQVDVTDEQAMTTLFARLGDTTLPFPPLRGVIHAAGIVEQESSGLPSWDRSAAVMAPKVAGSWHLHRLSQPLDLDFFVLFSSASSLLGLVGQRDYAAANAFLDALAVYRQQSGLPALSISWGDWAEVGMAANAQSSQQPLAKPLQVTEGVAAFQQLLGRQGHIGVMMIAWHRFTDVMQAHRAFLAHCVGNHPEAMAPTAPVEALDLRTQLVQTPVAERTTWLTHALAATVRHGLGLAPTATIDPQQNLLALGYDSLMLIELRNHLRQRWGVHIELPRFLQGITVHDIVDELLTQLAPTATRLEDATAPALRIVVNPEKYDREDDKKFHSTNGAANNTANNAIRSEENEGEEQWVTVRL